MSIKTREVSELEQLEELSGEENVLMEADGTTKRFPAAKLGTVKTANGAAPDENGNVEIDLPEIPESIAPPAKAEVGQYLIVKAVDENGKPTEWEPVDRTHWKETVNIPETELTAIDDGFVIPGFVPVAGGTYEITWNGTVYSCAAAEIENNGETGVALGNVGLIDGTGDTGEPFVMAYAETQNEQFGYVATLVMPTTDIGDTVPTVAITGGVVHKVPGEYIPPISWDNLADHPEGIGYMEEVVLCTDAEFELSGSNIVAYGFIPVEGNTYKVTWNGAPYTCTAYLVESEGVSYACVGNGLPFGLTDTGEPFLLYAIVASNTAGSMVASDDENPTVRIATDVARAIPAEYIPPLSELENDLFSAESPIPSDWMPEAYELDLYSLGLAAFSATEGTETQTVTLDSDTRTAVVAAIVRNRLCVGIRPSIASMTFYLYASWYKYKSGVNRYGMSETTIKYSDKTAKLSAILSGSTVTVTQTIDTAETTETTTT